MQDWRVCAGGEGRVALSSRRVGKPIHVHARRELQAAAPASPSVHINSPGDRTPCEPLSAILMVVWRLASVADRPPWRTAMHKHQRTTIEQRSETKRQQHEQLKLLTIDHGKVAGECADRSCGAQASRHCRTPVHSVRQRWDVVGDRTREHR